MYLLLYFPNLNKVEVEVEVEVVRLFRLVQTKRNVA